MKVTTLRSEPFSSNLHLVEVGDEAMLVDAGTGADAESVERQLRRVVDPARVKAVYCTHLHCDHVGGCAALKRLTGAEVVIHASEAAAVERGDAVATLGAAIGLRQEPCPVRAVKEGDAIEVGGRRFDVIEVPGHTPGHTALWEPESRSLFAGDLAFPMGSFGRVDFPGGDADALLASLERVAAMPVENLYPGHMEPVEGRARDALRWSLESAREMLA